MFCDDIISKKRRQLDSIAMENLKNFLVTSKKYRADPMERHERIHLLTNAACNAFFPLPINKIAFIQENAATLNILLGVLCTTLLNSQEVEPAIHFAIKDENSRYSCASLFDTFNVPSSVDALME